MLLNGDSSGRAKTQLAEELEQLKKENEELKVVMRGMATVFGQEILAKAKEQAQKELPNIACGVSVMPLTPYEALIILGKKKLRDSKVTHEDTTTLLLRGYYKRMLRRKGLSVVVLYCCSVVRVDKKRNPKNLCCRT